jgi:plastocyanin domain-containing protein
MKVRGYDYTPSRFTVAQGIPVEWQIDGSEAAGCAQVITLPKMGITEYLPKGVKTIAFTPSQTGELEFKCTMGMTTRGAAFIVVPNTGAASGASAPSTNQQAGEAGPAQKLSMTISRDNGFSPNLFTVKKDLPVELEIDTQTPLGGCMGTMVIPKYNIAHLLSLGKTTLRFTPTQIETIRATCPMGSPMIAFQIVE